MNCCRDIFKSWVGKNHSRSDKRNFYPNHVRQRWFRPDSSPATMVGQLCNGYAFFRLRASWGRGGSSLKGLGEGRGRGALPGAPSVGYVTTPPLTQTHILLTRKIRREECMMKKKFMLNKRKIVYTTEFFIVVLPKNKKVFRDKFARLFYCT